MKNSYQTVSENDQAIQPLAVDDRGDSAPLSSRERFLRTLEFKTADPAWIRWGSFIWDKTIAIWRTQGYDGRPLDDVWGLDRLVRVDPWYGPVPPFAYQVIEDNDLTVTYINHEGILMREFKQDRDTSMPQFLKFPVENETDFDRFVQERLQLNRGQRFSEDWRRQVSSGGRLQGKVGKDEEEAVAAGGAGVASEEQWPRLCWADRWGGFFGALRNLMGVEGLCYAFYDQPALVEKMMAERAQAIIDITQEVLKYTAFETFWFWEDMAYNHGPLMDPDLFRKFAFPHYQRVCDWLHRQGIRHIGLDSDGNISRLIPVWIDSGINVLWPFEVQAGMDVCEVRKKYGHDLVIMGGINKKEIAKGNEAMRREVNRVMPLVEDGGYIPELDHSIPPDISWPAFCDYLAYLKHRLGRG